MSVFDWFKLLKKLSQFLAQTTEIALDLTTQPFNLNSKANLKNQTDRECICLEKRGRRIGFSINFICFRSQGLCWVTHIQRMKELQTFSNSFFLRFWPLKKESRDGWEYLSSISTLNVFVVVAEGKYLFEYPCRGDPTLPMGAVVSILVIIQNNSKFVGRST